MKISLDWISDFVDLSDQPIEQLCDRITLGVAEVEEFIPIRRHVDGVMVGRILSAEAMTIKGEGGDGEQDGGGKPLFRVEIDCGARRYSTVTTAPNARAGLRCAFAPVGTVLAGDQAVRAATVYGVESQGVLCSAAELGMSNWHEILLEIPDDVAVGTPLGDLVPPEEILIDIDNKSLTHRPDLWGHYGFAREIAAVLQRPLKPLAAVDLAAFDHLPEWPVAIADLDGCPAYSAIRFDMDRPASSPAPLTIQRRLHAIGQRTLGLMIDLTNYVMFELGQPTHAFEGAIMGPIRVARAAQGSRFTTLDGREHVMQADDLLIFNEDQPAALAGVMGGRATEVGPETTGILLESANFAAARIRRTAVRLGLRSEASLRFEKSQPTLHVKTAPARMLKLLEQGGTRCAVQSRFSLAGEIQEGTRPLILPAGFIQKRGGAAIDDARIIEILHSLAFGATLRPDGAIAVEVPPHRPAKDISRPVDLLEEVLRIHGYDNIAPVTPVPAMKPTPVDEGLAAQDKVRRFLSAGCGYLEVQTYAWFDDDWIAALGFQPEHAIGLANPATQQSTRLCTTLVPNMLALAKQNVVHRDRYDLYEFGRIFTQPPRAEPLEQTVLAGVSYAQKGLQAVEAHFGAVKGTLEEVARLIDVDALTLAPVEAPARPWESAGETAIIRSGEKEVGRMGLLSGSVAETVAERGQVVWFEILMSGLEPRRFPRLDYVAAPTYPRSWQDFSILFDQHRFGDLVAILDRFEHPIVRQRHFLTVYRGKLPPGQESYSFRFWLGLGERTLTAEDLNGFREAFLGFLRENGLGLR